MFYVFLCPFSLQNRMLSAATSFIESYGWYLLVGAVAGTILYFKYIQKSVREFVERRNLEAQKKFDENVQEKYGDNLRAARERQYQQHLKDVELQHAREAERAERKREAEEAAVHRFEEQAPLMAAKNQPTEIDPLKQPEEFVRRKLAARKVVMFSKHTCAFSMKAKQALSTFRLSRKFYEVVELDELTPAACSKVQDTLFHMTGGRSVPRVFIDGVCIGGGDDTVDALRDGRLEEWLRAAKVL